MEAISTAGGRRLIEGLQRYGGATMRDLTKTLYQGVKEPNSQHIVSDTASHAKQAHAARLKHSKVWHHAAQPVRRAVAPQGAEEEYGG